MGQRGGRENGARFGKTVLRRRFRKPGRMKENWWHESQVLEKISSEFSRIAVESLYAESPFVTYLVQYLLLTPSRFFTLFPLARVQFTPNVC